jgi:microcystin-dependent protein
MTDCFVGELRIFSSANLNNIPDGWVPCEGQMLQVSQNQALFALLGTQFGGNGQTTFGLPDLRSRVIVAAKPGSGQPYATVGGKGGAETVALTSTQVPVHTHTAKASTATDSVAVAPNNNYIGAATNGTQATAANLYTPLTSIADMLPLSQSSLTAAGGGSAHENRQMVLALRICIATSGIFPQRP